MDGKAAPFLDVVRGMMKFSSNANTEYLFEKLGLDNIKNIVKPPVFMSFKLKSSCCWSNCNVICPVSRPALDVEIA